MVSEFSVSTSARFPLERTRTARRRIDAVSRSPLSRRPSMRLGPPATSASIDLDPDPAPSPVTKRTDARIGSPPRRVGTRRTGSPWSTRSPSRGKCRGPMGGGPRRGSGTTVGWLVRQSTGLMAGVAAGRSAAVWTAANANERCPSPGINLCYRNKFCNKYFKCAGENLIIGMFFNLYCATVAPLRRVVRAEISYC